MSDTAVFFDLDGTLLTGHLYSEVLRRRMRSLSGGVRATSYLLTHLTKVPLYRLGLMDTARFYTSWGVDLAGLLKGMPKTEGGQLLKEAAQRLLTTARPEMVDLVRKHRLQGQIAVLVSSSFQPVLDEVAKRLHIPHAVGTALEERDGHLTGRLAGTLCFGKEKAAMLQGFLQQSGLDIDLEESYAYADRYDDVPFLELVGHPVATYPDPRLLAYAVEKGWKVING
ncbi:MAG: HAD family hydrolase [Dehalococcoidia bacterium]